jgi:hypothetical protein
MKCPFLISVFYKNETIIIKGIRHQIYNVVHEIQRLHKYMNLKGCHLIKYFVLLVDSNHCIEDSKMLYLTRVLKVQINNIF